MLRDLPELLVKIRQLLGESPTTHQMDKAAKLVQTYISGAADSAIPYKKSSLFSKRWWTQELSELRTLMARSRRLWKQNRDDSLLLKEFHRYRNNNFHKIREAKRATWTNWLSQAKGNDIWQAYKYTKPCKVEKLPPIQSNSGPVSSGVSSAATVGVRHAAVPRSNQMRLSMSMEAKHTVPLIRLSMTAYLRHAAVGQRRSGKGSDDARACLANILLLAMPPRFFLGFSRISLLLIALYINILLLLLSSHCYISP